MNDQVGHVSDQIGLQAKNEEHVEDVEYHFHRIYGMEITIANACKCDYGPVH